MNLVNGSSFLTLTEADIDAKLYSPATDCTGDVVVEELLPRRVCQSVSPSRSNAVSQRHLDSSINTILSILNKIGVETVSGIDNKVDATTELYIYGGVAKEIPGQK